MKRELIAKKRMKTITVFLLGIVLSVAGTLNLAAQKEILREERGLSTFTKFDIGIAGEVFLTQGKTQKLEIEGDSKIIADIETTVSNGTLRVRYPNRFFQNNTSRVKIYITMPDIEGISISGSAQLSAENPLIASSLGLTISGSGRIKIADLTAEKIDSRISGSGGMEIGGSKNIAEHNVNISGSGSLNMLNLPTEKVSVNISGSGSCRILALNKLDARISGSGVIHYAGKPLVDARISGSGRVIQAK